MNRKLTWLHISDIHFHPKKEWRDESSRAELINYLKSTFDKNESLRPDLIFCTGDIAFGESHSSSLVSQYNQAKNFFDELLVVCGRNKMHLPKERLFVIPGNHDVNKNTINTDAQYTINLWAKNPDIHVESINQRFNDRDQEFKGYITRLNEYAQFVKEYLPHQYDIDERQHYAIVNEVNGIKLGIAGFNSAWTCSGPEDDRNIWLAAKWQFNSAKKVLGKADICIGMMHHPIDWLNSADRKVTQHRIARDFHFWLHGHSHSAWVTPIQSHIVIAAGAIGAQESNEFGVNLTSIDLNTHTGVTHLYSKKAESNGWTILPVEHHADDGQWKFDLPSKLRAVGCSMSQASQDAGTSMPVKQESNIKDVLVDKYLTMKLDEALRTYPQQPKVWIEPTIRIKSEISRDSKSSEIKNIADMVTNPRSIIIKAPPQYGLTCLACYMVREAWRAENKSIWLYLDAMVLKPHTASIDEAVSTAMSNLESSEQDIKCVILDSWATGEKDAFKLLKKLCERFKNVPIIVMQRADTGAFDDSNAMDIGRQFEVFYLWSLSRECIRKIVAAYNEAKYVGDEDAVTARIVTDLNVLNLPRTPLNCITLLKVSEVDFDESPINRSEMIKRVLFLLFNIDAIPTYKTRPDLKDCEYVLGYFCEQLIREGNISFTRDKFLNVIHKFCDDNLIDLETHVVFDVLHLNNIIVKRGSFYYFKFSYWIFYFTAQRMRHSPEFATYIFGGMRYAQYPEIIEFYTGIDRNREDALQILIDDIKACRERVKNNCGFPEGWNPYKYATWNPSSEMQAQMKKVIDDGVRESHLPSAIKDQYADRSYDQVKPYHQEIPHFLAESAYHMLTQIMSAGARALRNSDYASPHIKQNLMKEILKCWELITQILLVILPVLARDGRAEYDGNGFVVVGDLPDDPQQRFIRILCEIPSNIVSWFQDDLFSRKMGPLLMRQFESVEVGDLCKHELILLLIAKKPRDWSKHVQNYITSIQKNSYYLLDVYVNLRSDYRYCFASAHTLKDMEHLIKLAAAKHATGDKIPNLKTISKVAKANSGLIPPREIN